MAWSDRDLWKEAHYISSLHHYSLHSFFTHYIPSLLITFLLYSLHSFFTHYIPSLLITFLHYSLHSLITHYIPSLLITILLPFIGIETCNELYGYVTPNMMYKGTCKMTHERPEKRPIKRNLRLLSVVSTRLSYCCRKWKKKSKICRQKSSIQTQGPSLARILYAPPPPPHPHPPTNTHKTTHPLPHLPALIFLFSDSQNESCKGTSRAHESTQLHVCVCVCVCAWGGGSPWHAICTHSCVWCDTVVCVIWCIHERDTLACHLHPFVRETHMNQ